MNEQIFTLVKTLNVPNFKHEHILTRTNFVGHQNFISEFVSQSKDENKREFEYNKRETLINAFIENKGINTQSDVEWLSEIINIPSDKLLFLEKGNIDIDIFYVKTDKGIILDTVLSKDFFLQSLDIITTEVIKTTVTFITENDFGKAKYNWINLFK